MSILSTNKKLISIGQEYSAGSGISIDNYVISVTGDVGGKTYSAGDNISIYEQDNQFYISGKDWEQDIEQASANAYNAATAQIPTPFDLTYISAQIDNKLNESDFTAWQSGQYSTDLQTIEGQINNKLDSSSFSDVSGNFLTGINIPESATWNETSNVVKEGSASWNQGKTYEGISPIVVNNDENIVSADTWTFSAGDNVLFVDDNVNKITRIDVALPTPQDLSYISAQTDKANQGVDYLSGVVITALPSDMATTGDVAELAQTISETYYPNTNPSSFVNEDWVTGQGYITGVSIPDSATWQDVSTTVQTNSAQWAEGGGSGDEEVNSFVRNNSATIDEVNTTYQANSGSYQPAGNYIPYTAVNVGVVPSFKTNSGLEINTYKNGGLNSTLMSPNTIQLRYVDLSFNKGSVLSNSDLTFENTNDSAYVDMEKIHTWDSASNYIHSISATYADVSTTVQSNSAQWGQGGGAISSYTTAYSHDIPPYGGEVIDSLNGKYLSAYVSLSADNAKVAKNANSATYAQTVDETKLKNDGFVKNLTSEYGTISVVRNTIESTNSAIARIGNEGFVSSFQDKSIGPSVTANFSWDKSLPNTTFNFTEVYASNNTIIAYSANTNLTGEVTVTSVGELQFSVDVPNATELNVWSNGWIQIKNNVASAADTFETVVGELAWASALPTYQYDSTNKISAINGSAIAGQGGAGNPEVESYVQTNSGTIDDTVTAYQTNSGDYLKESELGYNAVDEVSAINGSAIAQYGAEKQWLVHDDTLVHASNSAQYALGVNISAVAQLLGVDETVLWSGSKNTTAGNETLFDNMWNYNELDFYLTFDTSNTPVRAQCISRYYIGNHASAQPLYVYLTANNISANTLTSEVMYFSGNSNGNSFGLIGGTRQVNSTVATGITSYNAKLVEIRGIGRKQ